MVIRTCVRLNFANFSKGPKLAIYKSSLIRAVLWKVVTAKSRLSVIYILQLRKPMLELNVNGTEIRNMFVQ